MSCTCSFRKSDISDSRQMSDARDQRARRGGGYGRRPQRQPHSRSGGARGADSANWRRGGNEREGDATPSGVGAKRELSSNVEAVRGECDAMCSEAEVRSRTETRELSRFETPPVDGATLGAWAVKKYRRPAAGRVEIDTKELRPPPVLTATLEHLFSQVLPWKGCGFDWTSTDESGPHPTARVAQAAQHDFLSLYHFVSDRVRSVRQDFVVQRVYDFSRVNALVQIARFYVLASFRATQLLDFSDRTLDWSETLNDQQLASALTEIHAQFQSIDLKTAGMDDDTYQKLHQEAFALDVLLHLRDPRSVSVLLLKVPSALLGATAAKLVLSLFVAFHSNNFRSFQCAYSQLPLLHQCLAIRHLPVVWTTTLTMMNKAYGKLDQFGLDEIAKSTGMPGEEEVRIMCTAMNVHLEHDVSTAVVGALDGSTREQSSNFHVPRTSFAKFKVNPIRDQMDDDIVRELVRLKAISIQAHLSKRFTAKMLVLSTE